jgi:ABC-2 type transport system ATP-binding protein
MSDVIVTEDLGHAYGDHVALHHVSVAIPEGRIGLVGANGAGKTTLIRILLGILRPTVGHATVFDTDPRSDPVAVRARIGYMPELDCLPVAQTAADFMVYAAELAGIPSRAARQRASDVLTLVGLDEERFRPLGGFSTGMKQRAKLAQAIVHDPELVLLDEPTAGLDPEGRDDMLDLISRLGGFGINVVTSSHVLSDIEATCDWVVMLDAGSVLRQGPLHTMLATDTVEVELFDDPAPVLERLGAAGCTVEQDGHRLTVSAAEGNVSELIIDAVVASGMGIRRMGSRAQSLEDVFLTPEGGGGLAVDGDRP